MNLNTEEARLVAIYRAIKDLERPELVSAGDVGEIHELIGFVFDVEKKENDLSAQELRALLLGFVGGLGASRIYFGPAEELPDEHYTPEIEDETYFQGGRTGGTAEGQGSDPRYVVQTGVHGNENKSEE